MEPTSWFSGLCTGLAVGMTAFVMAVPPLSILVLTLLGAAVISGHYANAD